MVAKGNSAVISEQQNVRTIQEIHSAFGRGDVSDVFRS